VPLTEAVPPFFEFPFAVAEFIGAFAPTC